MKTTLLLLYLSVIISLPGFAQLGDWTWVKGSNFATSPGSFGTQGIPSPFNNPPGNYGAANWKDADGNFWIFGGWTYDIYGDLWRYNPSTNEWTWMKGSGVSDDPGNYGTMGVPSPTNLIPARGYGAARWVDKNGNFWLYGGHGCGPNYIIQNFADLWKYDVSTNEWTWMSGDPSATAVYGTQGVSDPNNTPGKRFECTANWVDSKGNFWMYGGLADLTNTSYGDLWKYDPLINEWTWMSGSNVPGQAAVYGPFGQFGPDYSPGARYNYCGWSDCDDNFWLFGGKVTRYGQPDTLFNDVWKYNIAINQWAWVSGSSLPSNNGNAGTACDTSHLTRPKARWENRAVCKDSCGNIFMYGGMDKNGGLLSDLWFFQPKTLLWTLLDGVTSANVTPVWGTQGVSNPANTPGGREGALAFMGDNGNVYIFGGSATAGYNDVWKYVPDPNCPAYKSCNPPCPIPLFSTPQPEICEKFCVDFFDQSTNSPTAWLWLFPGGAPSSSAAQNPSQICYQVPGTYDVTLITTNASGNDTLTLTDYITVYSTPPFPVITQNGYTLTSSTATSYQWQLNNVDIPGATNQSYDVQQSGYYTVFITDQNGCVSSTTTYILIDGIEEVNADANVLVYPNPSEGNFIVEFSSAKASENTLLNCSIADQASIKVYNTIGQVVFSERKISSASCKMEIDLRRDAKCCVSTGIYFIEISALNSSDEKRDIIARRKIIITK